MFKPQQTELLHNKSLSHTFHLRILKNSAILFSKYINNSKFMRLSLLSVCIHVRIYTLFVTYIQADMYAAKCSTWTMAPRQITDVSLLKLDNIKKKKNFTDKNPSS